jgi:hypothetical protein
MCKNAIGSDRNHFGQAINTSVLFMIGMVFTVLASFLAIVWWSYRSAARREARGDVFAPAGKVRWSGDQHPN